VFCERRSPGSVLNVLVRRRTSNGGHGDGESICLGERILMVGGFRIHRRHEASRVQITGREAAPTHESDESVVIEESSLNCRAKIKRRPDSLGELLNGRVFGVEADAARRAL